MVATLSEGMRTSDTTDTVMHTPRASRASQCPVNSQHATSPAAARDAPTVAPWVLGASPRGRRQRCTSRGQSTATGSSMHMDAAPKAATTMYSTRKLWM